MIRWACDCDERSKAPKYRNWIVYKRNCNYSAFNGYHYTPSDYSALQCHSCRAIWRTKANYVSLISDGDLV